MSESPGRGISRGGTAGVLAIDPGSAKSAWLRTGPAGSIVDFGILANEDLIEGIRLGRLDAKVVVVEQVESFGMAVAHEVFVTTYWSGRFHEAAFGRRMGIAGLTRKEIKLHLCGSLRAKDPNIRQAIVDRYGGGDARGTKRSPGPLYGIGSDVWAALAVALTWNDKHPAPTVEGARLVAAG